VREGLADISQGSLLLRREQSIPAPSAHRRRCQRH